MKRGTTCRHHRHLPKGAPTSRDKGEDARPSAPDSECLPSWGIIAGFP